MVLQVDPVPDLSIDVDSELICYGASATLYAVGDADYQWSSDIADTSLTAQDTNQVIIVTPLETTTYTLVGVVAGFDCPATITQTIQVKPELLSAFLVQEDETCQGETFSVMYNGNASPGATYNWNYGDANYLGGSGAGPIDIMWDSVGIQTITLSVDEDNCTSDSTSTEVNVLPTPVPAFDATPVEDCTPFTVDFNNTSSNLGSSVSYLWDFGTGNESTDQSPSHTYNQPGTYNVGLVVTNNSRCSNSISLSGYIVANETPVADFEAAPEETVLEEPTIYFTDNSTSGDMLTYSWDFGDNINTSTEQSPSNRYSNVGVYLVKLLVTTVVGCESEMQKEVTIHPDFVVYAPTAFSPNGDGLNDVFELKGVGVNKFLLQIYSRWGELMFESKSLEDKWDGKFKGELVPAGTYVYSIYYTSMINSEYHKQGSVTVLR